MPLLKYRALKIELRSSSTECSVCIEIQHELEISQKCFCISKLDCTIFHVVHKNNNDCSIICTTALAYLGQLLRYRPQAIGKLLTASTYCRVFCFRMRSISSSSLLRSCRYTTRPPVAVNRVQHCIRKNITTSLLQASCFILP